MEIYLSPKPKNTSSKFLKKYWAFRSQHRKYYGYTALLLCLLAGFGTYDLVRRHDNMSYVADEFFDKHLYWFIVSVFVYFLGMECLCFRLLYMMCRLMQHRLPSLLELLAQIALVALLFSYLMPLFSQEMMKLFMSAVMHMEQPDMAYLHDKYNKSRFWLTVYPFIWALLFYWRSKKRKGQDIGYLEKRLANLLAPIEQQLPATKVVAPFIVIRKKDISYELRATGELFLIQRRDHEMHQFVEMYYTQISKSVHIYSSAIQRVHLKESYVEISQELYAVLEASIKNYVKLKGIVQNIKSMHGLLHLSKIYVDKIDPKKIV